MAGEYYSHSNFPQTNTRASSALMRAELDKIETGFDKLPVLAGNGSEIVTINSGATALESKTPAELHLARDDGDTYTGTHDFTGATVAVATQAASDISTKPASTAFVNSVAMNAALPAQSAPDAGKVLQTNGTTATWMPIFPQGIANGGTLPSNQGFYSTAGATFNMPDLTGSPGLMIFPNASTATASDGYTVLLSGTTARSPTSTVNARGTWGSSSVTLTPPLKASATITGVSSISGVAQITANTYAILSYNAASGVSVVMYDASDDTLGTPVSLHAINGASHANCIYATATGFICSSATTTNYYINACTVSGKAITAVAATVVPYTNNANSSIHPLVKLSDTSCLLVDNQGNCNAITVSGTTVTAGADTSYVTGLSGTYASLIGVEVVNSTTVLVAMAAGAGAPYTLNARTITVSGTTATPQANATGAATLHVQSDIGSLRAYASGGPFLCAYRNNSTTFADGVGISVSGVNTTINATPIALSSAAASSDGYIARTYLAETQSLCVPYSSSVMLYTTTSTMVAVSISGTTLTAGANYWSSGTPAIYKDVSTNTKFLYLDGAQADIITVSGTTITPAEDVNAVAYSASYIAFATPTFTGASAKIAGTWYADTYLTSSIPLSATRIARGASNTLSIYGPLE